MTTPTITRPIPPTEHEIRAAVIEALHVKQPIESNLDEIRSHIRDAAAQVRAPAWDVLESTDERTPDAMVMDGLWVDMRPTEARRLMVLYDEAIDRATARSEAIIVEELTAAGVVFAREFPDAPRPA